MDRNGAGYSFDVLRDKALLKHGHFGTATSPAPPPRLRRRRGEVAEFMVTTPSEPLELVEFVRVGVPISTLKAGLDAGRF